MMRLSHIEELFFPKHLYWNVVAHAQRKLEHRYLAGEEAAPKAYGLVGGQLFEGRGEITHVFPLARNLRDEVHLKPELDQIMTESAIPSETPLEQRGWVSDPREVMAAEHELDRCGKVLFGGYHMHRVAWDHDPDRDTCTEVDTRLAKGSGMWVFILSMVNPHNPVLRAYFEGNNDAEAPVRLGHYV